LTPKLAVATGTRAEYGIFRPLLREFDAREWRFELYATGTHLSPSHGLTIDEIEADGYEVHERVNIGITSDTPQAVTRSMGLAVMQFGQTLERRRPDLLFLLGDRFEALAIAAAAQVAGVPVAHLHGGERTEGLIDEAFRHSITKMSQLHFVSAEPYRKRVVQLGEGPETVFNVGALGLDNVKASEFLDRTTLERDLDFRFRHRNFLVTQHPLTLDLERSRRDFEQLLGALGRYPDAGILITAPNADTGGGAIADMIVAFAASNQDRVRVVTSLGTGRYFSVLRQVDLVIGNSSSGLIEVPSFCIPTVNVGDRQTGRLAGPSVISTPANADAIASAIDRALEPSFRELLRTAPNPYGRGDTAQAICDIVGGLCFPIPLQKRFWDLP
jgi:UDP-hydrolysing UDP-N-acetyl-D-glucosamine 2-epimerase